MQHNVSLQVLSNRTDLHSIFFYYDSIYVCEGRTLNITVICVNTTEERLGQDKFPKLVSPGCMY